MPNCTARPWPYLVTITSGWPPLKTTALTFDPNAPAANGKDTGAFTLHFDKVPAAVDSMMKTVGVIKATADRAAAEALAKKYVDGTIVPQPLITERMLRSPKASFVYGVTL